MPQKVRTLDRELIRCPKCHTELEEAPKWFENYADCDLRCPLCCRRYRVEE